MASDDQRSRRIERLRQELADEVQLTLSNVALEELAYAKYMDPHEGIRPAYGAVVSNVTTRREAYQAPPLPSAAGFLTRGAGIDILRRFADGRTAFLMRGGHEGPAIAIDAAWRGDESALAAYAAVHEVTVIQRLATGRIRIYLGDSVYSEESGTWLARPTAVAYQAKVANVIDADKHEVAQSILDLCVHTLSPAGHGATLVWFPSRSSDVDGWFVPAEADPHLDMAVAETPPPLSAADTTHAPAIAHALGQMDRAVVLDDAGRLLKLNVTLRYAEDCSDHSFSGGTRHNSAGRYSVSDGRAVVFVVSADGPVTVFHRGEIVAAIQSRDADETE